MNLFKLILKAVWFLMVSMVGIALIMMIYQAVEDGALIRVFKIDFNWEALSAIGTLLAVFVAVISPYVVKWDAIRNIGRLIESELKDNMKIIEQISTIKDQVKYDLPAGLSPPPPYQLSDALRKSIDLRNWHEFKYQLAVHSSYKFERYRRLNKLAESIRDADMEPPELRLELQVSESQRFVELFREFKGRSI